MCVFSFSPAHVFIEKAVDFYDRSDDRSVRSCKISLYNNILVVYISSFVPPKEHPLIFYDIIVNFYTIHRNCLEK